MEIERGRKGLLTPPFYLLVTLVNDFFFPGGEEGVSKTICSYDITIKTVDMPLSKEEKKRMFLQSAGKIKIDAEAVKNLRERSII